MYFCLLHLKIKTMSVHSEIKKITTETIRKMKQDGEKISMLTAYDYTTAGIIDQAGVDGILVGDSASNVMAGNSDTLPITIDEMIYHARSVAKAVKRALVICDMPFGSYQISREEGIKNAIRIMKETGVDALKIEGGAEIADTIKGIIHAGIPVMGHLGLTPQSIHKFGGYGLRAKTESEAKKLMDDVISKLDFNKFISNSKLNMGTEDITISFESNNNTLSITLSAEDRAATLKYNDYSFTITVSDEFYNFIYELYSRIS